MKSLLALAFCIMCCIGGICKADVSIVIGSDKEGFKAVLENPTDAEVVRVQALQSQQVLIKLALKGCNKQGLLKKLFGSD
jgi:hypothetical protein